MRTKSSVPIRKIACGGTVVRKYVVEYFSYNFMINSALYFFQKHTITTLWFFAICFVILGAFYIYGINESAVHVFGKFADNKRLMDVEEELRVLETERAHLAVGSWLEARARQYDLITGGVVHTLSRDTAVARAE